MKKLLILVAVLFAVSVYATTEADMLKVADAGSADAQFELGMAYLRGDFGAADSLKAVEWLEKASYQGHSEAQLELGNLIFLGDDKVKADKLKGCAWLYTTKEPAGDYLCILQTTPEEKVRAQKAAADLKKKIKPVKK